MTDKVTINLPVQYEAIALKTKALGFDMPSDLQTGSLLRTLAASKPGGRILELGTGTGLATSWILSGMDTGTALVSVDNNELLISVAQEQLKDDRIEFVCADGYEWITTYNGATFDLIFADAMPGKYDLFEETFALLKTGGIYLIDDMLPQPNWPEGHAERVAGFIKMLELRGDLVLTKLNWSTGIIIAVKK
ncbi:O-methyltransferase [Niabella drilacis]|uniref:Predicted O-methyltransferase YrrM n=1 Tax=Niabella drilacis (strain DSM 25811 / CCM 8410 / CCUG 62505 / LMG 26954 / E90) TaxID=1285928 RepID=A0A1G6SYW9_NIADE|nr:methyltransferase domain-containing protein [Niabella drilacis]SDD22102.1 Predicted O-methyltransferase YrrM [Niabella drilacis]